MAIALQEGMADDPLNTVAVVPFDLPSPTTGRGASASSSSSSSLAAAASNLISAIAQGTATINVEDSHSDAGSEEGSSSFTYTAPAGASADDAEQQGWYASTPYHISNRYYDADITLKATKATLSSSTINTAQSTNTVLSQPYPAYVAVVDRSRSLEHHRHLAANLESKVAAGFDADISIVAGVSIISSSNSQLVTALDDEVGSSSRRQQTSQASTRAKTSDLVALYADHGWEFIAIDELDGDELDGDPELNADGEDGFSDTSRDDDTDGIERIREALMNHMWNGLVRKDQAGGSSTRSASTRPSAISSTLAHSSFSDAIDSGFKIADAHDDEADGEETLAVPSDRAVRGAHLDESLPSLDLNTHAEASDLDEQLAKLFLASSGSAEFAKLEAFLKSEDPSWPGPSSHTDSAPATFDDDFDDFLPFQSAPSHTTRPSTDAEDLPSMDDISQMQTRLFGANAAARLEAGPLGMGSQASEGDLASQLSQLQWHAQRVRNIQDPDQRRKEAALVALAFSMQWSTDGEADAGTMAF